MANCLVVYANALAYVMEHGGSVWNIPIDPYAESFRNLRRNVFCSYPRRLSLPLPESWWRHFMIRGRLDYLIRRFFSPSVSLTRHDAAWKEHDLEQTLASAPDSTWQLLTGWIFECPELVKKHRAAIVEFLSPAPRIEAQSDQLAAEARRDSPLLIGIHVRRGDYDKWMHGRYFYSVEQYGSWMEELRARHTGCRFLVVSNSYRELDSLRAPDVWFGGQSAATDMFALSQCDHIAGPPSTFSLFAAWRGHRHLCHMYRASPLPDVWPQPETLRFVYQS